jgi:hypothetical protein
MLKEPVNNNRNSSTIILLHVVWVVGCFVFNKRLKNTQTYSETRPSGAERNAKLEFVGLIKIVGNYNFSIALTKNFVFVKVNPDRQLTFIQ